MAEGLLRADIIVPAITGISGAVGGAFLNYWLTAQSRQDLKQSRKDNEELTKRVNASDESVTQLERLLAKQLYIRRFNQPVLLVGPPGIGKSSLLWHWHAPWSYPKMERSQHSESKIVPVLQSAILDDLVGFPGYPTVKVRSQLELGLRVWDFPGEDRFLEEIAEKLSEESHAFARATSKALGAVIVCFFNASKAIPEREWDSSYYTKCAQRLTKAIRSGSSSISRVIIVYNRFDELENAMPGKNTGELLSLCESRFREAIHALHGLVETSNRTYHLPAMLLVDGDRNNNRGINSIKALCAKSIVHAFAGTQTATGVAISMESTDTLTGLVAIHD